MPTCTNKGCGKTFDEDENGESSCSYHPGGPVFHEGLKSWSCCKDVNKPVMEFDQFMALPTCTTGAHSSAPVTPAPPTTSSTTAAATFVDENGKEVYGVAPKPPNAPSTSAPVAPVAPAPSTRTAPAEAVTEEDDPAAPVPADAPCKRLGCKAYWKGKEVSRGDGSEAKCRYHPRPAIFHEGSKGYLCCKRRVLEFDEFLRIEGCTDGAHLFVGAKRDETVEEVVPCRIDHYQTPTTVHVSAFAKGADKDRSSITFTPLTLSLLLYLPGNKKVDRTIPLYGPIDPEKCTFRILGTKVDITLVKPAPASWPLLELPPAGSELPPGYALTFGVSGRTGTVGGKEIVLAAEEMAKRG